MNNIQVGQARLGRVKGVIKQCLNSPASCYQHLLSLSDYNKLYQSIQYSFRLNVSGAGVVATVAVHS